MSLSVSRVITYFRRLEEEEEEAVGLTGDMLSKHLYIIAYVAKASVIWRVPQLHFIMAAVVIQACRTGRQEDAGRRRTVSSEEHATCMGSVAATSLTMG